MEQRDKELARAAGDNRGIIRSEEAEWPREFVKKSKQERDEGQVIRDKLIKFADEAAFNNDSNELDAMSVSTEFALRQVEDFF